MKRILFDIISLQGYHNGGEEYVRTVLRALLEYNDISIIGLYDSKLKFLDDDYTVFSSKFKLIDVQSNPIANIISEEKIDTFFIGIGQRFGSYDLSCVKCKTLCVIHDIGNIEYSRNRINYLFPKSIKGFLNILIDYVCPNSKYSLRSRINKEYLNIVNFISQENVDIITVSQYTANSLMYYFPLLKNKSIEVLYPPQKEYYKADDFEDDTLRDFVNRGKPFLLLLSIGRVNKNSTIVIDAFKRIKLDFPDLQLIVTGARNKTEKDDILYLRYVSNSDIENLYEKARALVYPSYTEGFGYPPIEAIKYGTPVISANVCSMTEVLGNAALYFSPFYQNDFYRQIKILLDKDKKQFSNLTIAQSKLIAQRQTKDFDKLVSMLRD